MSAIIFDTLDYTKGAEAIGIKREHAEYQAKQFAKIINDEFVTKSFLSTELKGLELRLVKWMAGFSIAQITLIVGILGFIIKT